MPTPLTTIAPEGTPRGGVVVVQEAFGVTEHIVDVCRRFAAAGYLAVAPHLFHRNGDPVVAYDDFATARPLMEALRADQIDEDVDAALAALSEASIGSNRSAVVGFCMGGTVAFQTAARRELGAAVTFYGGGIEQGRFGYSSLLDAAAALSTPWLGNFGDLDKGIPVEQVEELRAAVSHSSVDTEIIRYPDAEHGFHCDDRPAVFNEAAAGAAWLRTVEWLDSHF